MADTRLYIGNTELGLAAHFYSRLGSQYTLTDGEGLKQLVERVAEELVTSDDFVILQEGKVTKEGGIGRLLKITPESKVTPMVPESSMKAMTKMWSDAVSELESERKKWHNECVSLGRRLKDAEDKLAKLS
jgi:hypothetical protein